MPTQIFDISAEFTPDIIHIQHEYGLYGPQRGVHVIGLIVMYKACRHTGCHYATYRSGGA